MDDGLCFKCRKDLNKGREKVLQVNFGGHARLFHPACHCCSGPCQQPIRPSVNYTVRKATGLPVCEPCWLAEHHDGQPHVPAASFGLAWKPAPPAVRGVVWKRVEELDQAQPKEAAAKKAESKQRALGRCAVCTKAIYDDMVTLDKATQRHLACHTCARCRSSLSEGSFFVDKDGKTSCEACYAAFFAKLSVEQPAAAVASVAPAQPSQGACAVCAKEVTLKSVTARGKLMHEACFTCRKCCRIIDGKEVFFPEDDGSFTCEQCEQ